MPECLIRPGVGWYWGEASPASPPPFSQSAASLQFAKFRVTGRTAGRLPLTVPTVAPPVPLPLPPPVGASSGVAESSVSVSSSRRIIIRATRAFPAVCCSASSIVAAEGTAALGRQLANSLRRGLETGTTVEAAHAAHYPGYAPLTAGSGAASPKRSR